MVVLKLLLAFTNFSVLSYLIVLMLDHYNSHYDMKSWASIFHFFCSAWLLIRGAFWLSAITSVIRWTALNFYLLYWMPTPFEFGGFLLLPLYFAQILYTQEWNTYWKYIQPIYFLVVGGLILFQVVWACKTALYKVCFPITAAYR